MTAGPGTYLDDEDTIVGVATPPGAAGIAVVRLSGPGALRVGIALAPRLARDPRPRRLYLCRLVHSDTGELLDQALVCHLVAPRTYTGEEMVELHVHGGPATVAAVTAACRQAGARLARPGEFTLRAFRRGKIDLTAAEAVAALISAEGDQARRVALRQLEGGLGAAVRQLRAVAIALLAEVEADIDFPDEEIPRPRRAAMEATLGDLLRRLEDLVAQYPAGRLAREGARVVIAGRPNVGKSSLFNALLDEDRALVHAAAGTTRDYLEAALWLDGVRVTLVDTAGQHEAEDETERMGVVRAREQAHRADAVLLVVSAADGITAADARLRDQLGDQAVLVAINQIDRVTVAEVEAQRDAWSGEPAVPVSALHGTHLAELRAALALRLGLGTTGLAGLPLVTEERHRERLSAAIQALSAALRALAGGLAEELVAVDLRVGAGCLAEITGEGVGEAVLDAIFSRFCLGK
jgi:tRNA modification GTPase